MGRGLAISSKSQRRYQVGWLWAAGQDLQPGGKIVIATIWLSNPFSQPHKLGTAKITFTDEQSKMLKDEVVSLRAISKPTLSHKNRHPKMVVVAHELTHHLQTLAPQEYESFRTAVADYFTRAGGEAASRYHGGVIEVQRQRGRAVHIQPLALKLAD